MALVTTLLMDLKSRHLQFSGVSQFCRQLAWTTNKIWRVWWEALCWWEACPPTPLNPALLLMQFWLSAAYTKHKRGKLAILRWNGGGVLLTSARIFYTPLHLPILELHPWVWPIGKICKIFGIQKSEFSFASGSQPE